LCLVRAASPGVAISAEGDDGVQTGHVGEWLKSWAHEIHDVAGIAREGPLVQVAAIPGVPEELDGPLPGLKRTREAAGFACQAGQIGAQCGIVGLDGGGLALARRASRAAGIVDEPVLGLEIVGVRLGRVGTALDDLLQPLRAPFPQDIPAEDAARGALYLRDAGGYGFLCVMKV
jgi:hypothetical protein